MLSRGIKPPRPGMAGYRPPRTPGRQMSPQTILARQRYLQGKQPPPARIQGTLNRIIGATPERPLRIPIQFGTIGIETERRTENLLIGGLAVLVLGAFGIAYYLKQ